jgi:hypothetical protein
MIKANELRLENWVYVVDKESTPQKQPIQVNLTWMQIPEALEPIPLTTELLVSCGFNKDNYGLFEKVKDNAPYTSGCIIELWAKRTNDRWQFAVGTIDNLFLIAEYNYLHQLQNLFYSLTGTELEINLSEKV